MNFRWMKKNIKTPRVILVRHGHTDFNGVEDKIHGWLDVPLNDKGHEDADTIKTNLKFPVDGIFSSDLIRARETADIINQDHKAPIIDSDALRPWNLGHFQGRHMYEVVGQINLYVENQSKLVPSGESFSDFRQRYISFLDRIICQAIKEKQTLIVVTHVGNMNLTDGWIQNGMMKDFSINRDVGTTNKFSPGKLFEIPINDYIKRNM